MEYDGYVKILTLKDVYMPGVYRVNLDFYAKNRILFYKNPVDGKMRHIDKSIFDNLLSRTTSNEHEKMMRLTGLFKISEYFKSKYSSYLCDHDEMDHHIDNHHDHVYMGNQRN